MADPDEREASLALRDGEPEALRGAVDWYRSHHRLHCGDPVTMAADALAAYTADTTLGRDALLLCDTTEMLMPSTSASTTTASTRMRRR